MNRVMRSVSAEWRKVMATKMWWIMALVLAVYAALMAGTFAAMFGVMSDVATLDEGGFAGMVYAATATLGYAAPLLFGAIMATGELRHNTLGLAFLAEPKRGIVLAAKIKVLVLVGLLIGVAGIIGSVGAGAPLLMAFGLPTGLDTPGTWLLLFRVVLAIALWAVIGFGVGLIVRNQAITIVLVLVFTQFLEPTLRMAAMFWEWSANVAKFLPGAASDSFVGASVLNDLASLDPSAPANPSAALGIWAGLGVLVLYGLVTVGIGQITRWRSDIQ